MTKDISEFENGLYNLNKEQLIRRIQKAHYALSMVKRVTQNPVLGKMATLASIEIALKELEGLNDEQY